MARAALGGKGSGSQLRYEVPETTPSPYASLRLPNFGRYIVGLLCFTVAIQIQGTVVGWQIYELTHDKLALGLIGLAEALPFISVALYAGHVADRHDKRRVCIVALAVLLGCSVALLVLPLFVHRSQTLVVRSIYAVIVVSGFARSFLQPARQSLGAELVPRELFANAVTWRSGTWQLASVVGPAVGGLLYALGGARLAYAVDAALMVAGVTAISIVRHRSQTRREHTEAIGKSLLEGIRFVWHEPVILGSLTLDMLSVFFGGATALLPVFAAEILRVGPSGLGALRAAPAVGAVITSVVIAHLPPMRRTGRVLLRTVGVFGLCMMGFGLSTSFFLSLGLLALSGAADMVSVFIRSTLLQTRTPSHMLGRVAGVNAVFVGSSNEIGAFESGAAAQLLGTVPSVVLGGVLTLVVVALTAWRLPTLRRLDRMADSAGTQSEPSV